MWPWSRKTVSTPSVPAQPSKPMDRIYLQWDNGLQATQWEVRVGAVTHLWYSSAWEWRTELFPLGIVKVKPTKDVSALVRELLPLVRDLRLRAKARVEAVAKVERKTQEEEQHEEVAKCLNAVAKTLRG